MIHNYIQTILTSGKSMLLYRAKTHYHTLDIIADIGMKEKINKYDAVMRRKKNTDETYKHPIHYRKYLCFAPSPLKLCMKCASVD